MREQTGSDGTNRECGRLDFRNNVSTGLGPRVGFAWDLSRASHDDAARWLRHLLVREDVGAVDQLSFQSPFIPIVFFGQTPGFTMSDFFTGTPATNPNAVAAAGQISARGCLAWRNSRDFRESDTTQTRPMAACTGPGVNTTQNLFVLEVPRHFWFRTRSSGT